MQLTLKEVKRLCERYDEKYGIRVGSTWEGDALYEFFVDELKPKPVVHLGVADSSDGSFVTMAYTPEWRSNVLSTINRVLGSGNVIKTDKDLDALNVGGSIHIATLQVIKYEVAPDIDVWLETA